MAKLGLTCKDALEVFSQNETLKLQGQVTELTQQLGVYKLPEHFKVEAAEADELIKQCAKRHCMESPCRGVSDAPGSSLAI